MHHESKISVLKHDLHHESKLSVLKHDLHHESKISVLKHDMNHERKNKNILRYSQKCQAYRSKYIFF